VSTKIRDWGVLAAVTFFSVAAVWIPTGMQRIYENYDGMYYLAVAKSWYDPEFIKWNFSFPLPLEYYTAHFPLYPLLINLAGLTGINGPAAMLMVNLAATIAGAILIYWIFDKYHWGEPLTVTLVWLFWWPRMWAVRSVGSPETLFILLTVGSLYFFGQKKYWLSGIAGALAVLTKSPGILLLFAYGLALTEKYIKTKSLELKAYPILLIGLAIMGLFVFYGFKTGDFLAYFHSGDNIHLQVLPFKIFDSSQPWVGDFWLEDVLWVYLAGIVGVYYAFKKSRVWGWFGTVFLASIFFVSHRDISRYSLPLIPVVLLGLSDILKRREVKWVLAAMVIPLYFYTLNFVAHNYTAIADWAPFL